MRKISPPLCPRKPVRPPLRLSVEPHFIHPSRAAKGPQSCYWGLPSGGGEKTGTCRRTQENKKRKTRQLGRSSHARLLHSRGSPTPSAERKSDVGTSPQPSRGPEEGGNAVSRVHSWETQRQGRRENGRWLPHPCLLGGPKEGGNAMSPLHSRVFPNAKRAEKIRSGYLTPAFSGAKKRAEVLRHPYIIGGTQRQVRGANKKLPTSAPPSLKPRRGQKCYVTPAFLGLPNTKCGEKITSGYLIPALPRTQKRAVVLRCPCILGGPKKQARGANKKRLPHPWLPGGPDEGGNAVSPLHSRGSPTPSAERK